jgi:hypothetical protein
MGRIRALEVSTIVHEGQSIAERKANFFRSTASIMLNDFLLALQPGFR